MGRWVGVSMILNILKTQQEVSWSLRTSIIKKSNAQSSSNPKAYPQKAQVKNLKKAKNVKNQTVERIEPQNSDNQNPQSQPEKFQTISHPPPKWKVWMKVGMMQRPVVLWEISHILGSVVLITPWTKRGNRGNSKFNQRSRRMWKGLQIQNIGLQGKILANLTNLGVRWRKREWLVD